MSTPTTDTRPARSYQTRIRRCAWTGIEFVDETPGRARLYVSAEAKRAAQALQRLESIDPEDPYLTPAARATLIERLRRIAERLERTA